MSRQETLEQVIAEMRERERELFYHAYPRTGRNGTEEARAGALSEVQKWRGRLEAALAAPSSASGEEQEKSKR